MSEEVWVLTTETEYENCTEIIGIYRFPPRTVVTIVGPVLTKKVDEWRTDYFRDIADEAKPPLVKTRIRGKTPAGYIEWEDVSGRKFTAHRDVVEVIPAKEWP